MFQNVSKSTRYLTALAALTAITIGLQFFAIPLVPGAVVISLVLVPIAVGGILLGPAAGAWLGFVFGAQTFFMSCVLAGDELSAVMLQYTPIQVTITCLVKGTLCGLAAAYVYKPFITYEGGRYKTFGAVLAALVTPIVNTGLYIAGCFTMYEAFVKWFSSPTVEFGGGVLGCLWFGYSGAVFLNFAVELGVTVVLAPLFARLVEILPPILIDKHDRRLRHEKKVQNRLNIKAKKQAEAAMFENSEYEED